VVDLACLAPLETGVLEASVRKTSRLVVAHEAWRTNGFGAEIAATVFERCFYDLDAPVARVTSPQAPLPLAKPLRDAFLPDVSDVTEAIRAVLAA
jgi:pyruvate dehydrogenase E1 component beta subunit